MLGELKASGERHLVAFLSSLDDTKENAMKFRDMNIVSCNFTLGNRKELLVIGKQILLVIKNCLQMIVAIF